MKYIPDYVIKISKMGPTFYHLLYLPYNIFGIEYNWTTKDCPQIRALYE